jgi:hypothetical protein
MGDLIDELRKEHASIVALLNEVKQLGVASQGARHKLALAEKGLLGHLRKEDERLYPVLQGAAADDPKLARTLEVFATEMQEVSKAALGFTAKYRDGGDAMEFAKDFGRLSFALSTRIKREESILYVAYRQHAA